MNVTAPKLHDGAAQRMEWLTVTCCPVCGTLRHDESCLPDNRYRLGDDRIKFPPSGISIANCSTCGLIYKTVLPAPHSLATLFARQAANQWVKTDDFHDETLDLQRLVGHDCDLLNIGSSAGGVLDAWAQDSSGGRRSELDVARYPGIDDINGEFIDGTIDSHSLQWSGEPYDIVTLFDVAERLYAPTIAFENLRHLVRENGLVIIESGNVASEWPMRCGAHHWWYVRLLQHHLFWSRRSIDFIAQRFGFRLLIWREQRHKAHPSRSPIHRLNDTARLLLHRLTPRLQAKTATHIANHRSQPWNTFSGDHFRAVLRKG